MPAIRGITVAVGPWYAATLAVCLPRNMRHLTECVVVTAPGDDAVKAVAAGVPGVRVLETDAFTRHHAKFNKGLALEEGFDFLGRHGTILIHDADILLPDAVPFGQAQPGRLHGCRRRILDDPSRWYPGLNWASLPLSKDGNAPIGFFQLFHAEDPALASKRPWYDVSFAHAGGCDAAFMEHWHRSRYHVLPFDCLHLGPKDRHWFGTDAASKDLMAAFVVRNGWGRNDRTLDRTASDRVGEIVERVEVPGYAPSTYELPFVQREKARQSWRAGNHPV